MVIPSTSKSSVPTPSNGTTRASRIVACQSAIRIPAVPSDPVQSSIRALRIMKEIADMLQVGLTEDQLSICMKILESGPGISPKAFADFVKNCREAQ